MTTTPNTPFTHEDHPLHTDSNVQVVCAEANRVRFTAFNYLDDSHRGHAELIVHGSEDLRVSEYTHHDGETCVKLEVHSNGRWIRTVLWGISVADLAEATADYAVREVL
jgi:hypothetical protein